MSFVIDCSAAIDSFRHPHLHALPDSNFYAPELIDIEYANALRGLVTRGEVTEQAADQLIELWAQMDVFRSSHRLLLSRVWELRNNLSAYDATYVVLAERLQIPLITTDRRLARAAAAYCEVITLD